MRAAKRKLNLYPVAVDVPFDVWCSVKPCSQQVKWKILDNFYCDLHIVHPKQLKLNGILEGQNVERQGKEDAKGNAADGAGGDLRPGEAVLQVGRDGIDEAGKFVGSEQPAEAGQTESREAIGPGAVHENESGEPESGCLWHEEDDPFDQPDEARYVGEEEFGTDDDL